MFLELLYYFLSMDSVIISISSLFLLGHGLLYFAKILIDSTCDFVAFQVSSENQFLNDNAHEKLVSYMARASALGISERTFVFSLSAGIVAMVSFTCFLMKEFNVDIVCCSFVGLAIIQQCS